MNSIEVGPVGTELCSQNKKKSTKECIRVVDSVSPNFDSVDDAFFGLGSRNELQEVPNGVLTPLHTARALANQRHTLAEADAEDGLNAENESAFIAGNGLDVTWLVALNETCDTPEDEGNKIAKESRIIKKVKRKWPKSIISNPIIETPVTGLRRSMRQKRKICEDEETLPESEKKIKVSKSHVHSQGTPTGRSEKTSSNSDNGEQCMTEKRRKGLTITLKRSQPPNKIDRKVLTFGEFRRGLINPRKELAGSRYLVHSSYTYPPTKATLKNRAGNSISVGNPLDPGRVKTQQKLKWLENFNLLAVAKAHGSEKLGKKSKALTPAGDAIQTKGGLPTFNLDDIYDELLEYQSSLEVGRDFIVHNNEAKKSSDLNTEHLNTTFPNLNCFNALFQDQPTNLEEDKRRHLFGDSNRVMGAVKVDLPKLKRSKVFLGGRITFPHCGQHYRLNPAVVLIEKTPDEVIQKVLEKPGKVAEESPYYRALTSLPDKLISSSQHSSSYGGQNSWDF